MKKNKSFLSFIEDLKSEINDIKAQIDEVGNENKNSTLKASSKPKNKKNKNASKKIGRAHV